MPDDPEPSPAEPETDRKAGEDGKESAMTLSKAISILRTVVDHPDPFFHASLVLGAAQDHVVDLLQTVFYIIFSGGPDTGKGTANAAAMALTRNGIVLGGASGPYLRDTLGTGRAVAVSEFETLLKENQQLLAVIRNGNRRATSKVGLKIPDGNGWKNVEVDTFGYKTMDFHDRLDSHVLGRALLHETVRSKNLDVAMDAEYLAERLAPVREWLAAMATKARESGWNAQKVREVWDSPEFRARVRVFKNAWGWHGIIAAYLLLINDIFGFGLEGEIRTLMDARETELSEAAQEVQEAIEELAGGDVKPTTELRVKDDVLAKVNTHRKERGLPPRASVTGALRELGFIKGQDWISGNGNWSGPNRGKAIIRPCEKVRAWRTHVDDGSFGSSSSSHPKGDATKATAATVPPAGESDNGTGSAAWDEAKAVLQGALDVLWSLNPSARIEDITRRAVEAGFDIEAVPKLLKMLREEGKVWEPDNGIFRRGEGSL